MGEGKRRRQTLNARLASARGCVYCAAARPATTMDHMPPRAVFDSKRRPKGLEFPACEPCNAGTKTADQVVALMSRIYPDATTSEAKAEVQKYLNGVANNEPGLLREMFGSPEWRQSAELRVPQGAGMHALNCAGPLLNKNMDMFAAKFGFAMHYEATGRLIETDGGVAARWYPNAADLDGTFPRDVWGILGPPDTLRQGQFHVSDQFEYAWAVGEDGEIGIFLGIFRQAFAVLAMTSATPRAVFDTPPVEMRTWRPGELAH
uniref:HNH endonuclease n=1 Tax=Caulobacter sp. (strain K31) TaxID=366602 RepID=B0T6H8_CAUSK